MIKRDKMIRFKRFGAERLFNNITMSYVFVITTLFLQLISLATTFSGSKVYFGGVNLPLGMSAPLLFALSIQMTFFTLSNSLKRNYKSLTVMILIMTAICSSYFSYIGIYNHINSPVTYLQNNYQKIYDNISKDYFVTIDSSKKDMKNYIFFVTSNIQTEYNRLSKQEENYNSIQEEIDVTKANRVNVSTYTSNIAKPRLSDYGEDMDRYYEDIAKYNKTIADLKRNNLAENEVLQSQLLNQRMISVLNGKSIEEFEIAYIETKTNLDSISSMIDSIYNSIGINESDVTIQHKIEKIRQYLIMHINSPSKENKQLFTDIMSNMASLMTGISDDFDIKNFYKVLTTYSIIVDNMDVNMRDFNDLEREILIKQNGTIMELENTIQLYSLVRSEIDKGIHSLSIINDYDESIYNRKNDAYSIDNIYVYPVKRLVVDSKDLSTAWFCLLFAILIDGLTLLFALLHRNRRRVLLAKRNRDITQNDEEIIEDILLSTFIAGNKNEQEALNSLISFIDNFEITNLAHNEGYGLFGELSELEDYGVLLTILCQFNLARIITLDDFNRLKQHRHPLENQEKYQEVAISSIDNNEHYVLLKTKFIIWVSQILSSSARNSNASGSVLSIIKAIEE